MKHLFHILLIALMAVSLSGCYSTKQVSMSQDYQHACNGLTKEAAISQFGEPTRTYSTESGEVLVYESYEGEQTIANRRYLELTFNQQGICHNVQTNYTKPERYRDNKKTNWAVWGSIAGTAVGAAIVIPTTIWCIKNARK